MIYPNPKQVSYLLSECGVRLVRSHGGWIEGLVGGGWIVILVVRLSQCGDWNTVIIDDRLKKTTVPFILFKHFEHRYHDAK